MERYNYLEQICEDIRSYIEENKIQVNADNREEIESRLNDDLFIDDSVTGNGSGSYFCNAYAAAECLVYNYDLLGEAVENFGGGVDLLKSGAEACDVAIRCYLLPQAIALVLDEICEA